MPNTHRYIVRNKSVEQIGIVQGAGIDRSLNVWCLLFYERDEVVHFKKLVIKYKNNKIGRIQRKKIIPSTPVIWQ